MDRPHGSGLQGDWPFIPAYDESGAGGEGGRVVNVDAQKQKTPQEEEIDEEEENKTEVILQCQKLRTMESSVSTLPNTAQSQTHTMP